MARSSNSTQQHIAYLEQARAVARFLYIDRQEPITIEDVTDTLPLPEGLGYQVLGSIFRTTQWKRVGKTLSRPRPNGPRWIGRFVPVDYKELMDDDDE